MSQHDGITTAQQSSPPKNLQSGNRPQPMMSVPNDGLYLPPLHTSPSIITLQPSRISEEHQAAQRSASHSNLDWVSTPRSHMSVFSGTYVLSSVEQLEIHHIVDLNSLLGRSHNGSQYRVKIPRAEAIFLAVEDSKSCQRTFLRSSRELTLNIMDLNGEIAFVIRKSLSWGCVPAFLHKITVETHDLIGSVEQNFTIIGLSLTVYNESRQPICYIEGPNVYSCCMSTETQFQIVSVDKSRQIASFIRQWDHSLVDYSMLLTFTPETSIKLKGLLLGAAFLLEFLFFEHQRR